MSGVTGRLRGEDYLKVMFPRDCFTVEKSVVPETAEEILKFEGLLRSVMGIKFLFMVELWWAWSGFDIFVPC